MEAQKIKWGQVYLNYDCDGITKHPFFYSNFQIKNYHFVFSGPLNDLGISLRYNIGIECQ